MNGRQGRSGEYGSLPHREQMSAPKDGARARGAEKGTEGRHERGRMDRKRKPSIREPSL